MRWTPLFAMMSVLSLPLAAQQKDPDKPVRVYTVAYGAQADSVALSSIAKATGGQSFVAASPADIERVLLATLSE